MWSLIKIITLSSLAVATVVGLVVLGVNLVMVHSTQSGIFEKSAGITLGPVGVVLGNQPGNPFYEARMDAAAALYKSGKVIHLLVSGANPTKYYNEPDAMRNDLVRRGIPLAAITCDYAGRRTLDTVVRAKEIFGQTQCVFITQKFHLYRTLYLAKAYGLKAEGYTATEPDWKWMGPVLVREWAARCLAFLDVNIFDRKPAILGEKQPIVLQ
ncbi:MAG: ElyC/SanA/YdcF family protein [Verrucomicrobiota bacterium]|nr:ElyC/SanA/YdcF family protein [Verrucomicrobiota bacterium]